MNKHPETAIYLSRNLSADWHPHGVEIADRDGNVLVTMTWSAAEDLSQELAQAAETGRRRAKNGSSEEDS